MVHHLTVTSQGQSVINDKTKPAREAWGEERKERWRESCSVIGQYRIHSFTQLSSIDF
jgi:hypothetical protein